MIVSFVLPVFNCEGNITPLFEEFRSIAAKYPMFQPEYIFVDDASTDGSLKEIEALDSPYIKVLGLKKNVGSYSAALRGLEHVSGARVVVMAADGQDDPEIAYNLVGLCGDSDMCAAYRSSSTNGLFAKVFHGLMTQLSKPQGSGRIYDMVVFSSAEIPKILNDERCKAHLFYGLDAMIKSKMLFEHEKRERKVGRSGWTFGKKLKLAIEALGVFNKFRFRQQ